MSEIQVIARSLQTLFQQVTPESFARTFPRLVLDRTGATRAAFRVKNSKNWQIEGLSWQNRQNEAINTIIPPSLHDYLLAGEAIALADERGGGSIACFPLRLEERAIGHLYLEHPLPPDDFTRTHGDTLHLLLASGASALENARRYEQLEQAFPSESETKFRRLSENVPGVVYRYVQYTDGRDAFLYVSSRVREICGIDPETALADATAMWRMVHPEDVPKLQQAIADSLSDLDRPFQHDHRLITPSGQEKWVRVIGTPERQTNGDILWDGVIIDISDRVQIEIALQESQKFIQQIADSSPNVIYIYDLTENRNVYVNREVETFLGYTPIEIAERIDLSLATLLHPDDLAPCQQHFGDLATLADGEIAEFEYRMRHKNGQWHWFSSRDLVFKRDAAGRVIQILGNASDITERKNVEKRLEFQNALLARIAREEPLGIVLDALIAKIEQLLDGAIGSILFLDEADCLRHGVTSNLPPAYWQAVDGVKIGEGIGSCGTAAARGEAVSVAAIATDPLWRDYRDFALEYGLMACWSLPIFAGDGKVLGTFGVYYREERSPAAGELEIARQMANIAGIAIERERSRSALQESEARFRQIADTVREGFFVGETLPEHRYTYVNPAYVAMSGFSEAEIYADGNHWIASIHPEDRPRIEAALAGEFEGEIFDQEYRFVRPDGGIRWWRSQAFPLQNERGEVTRIVGTTEDISARKAAELNLQSALEFNQRIIDSAGEGVIVFGPDLRYQVWNPFMEELSGLPRSAVIGKHPLELFPFLGETGCYCLIQRALDGETITTPDTPFTVPAQGKTGWTSETYTPLYDERGEIIGVLAIVRDISDRKTAEQAIQESEARLQQAQRIAKLGNWEFDPATWQISWSAEMYHIFGYDPAFAPPTYEEFQATIHPEDRPALEKAIALAMTEGRPYEIEHRIQRPDGSIRYLFGRGEAVRNQQGEVIKLVGTGQDITEDKQAELELRRQEAQLRAIAANVPGGVFRLIYHADGSISCPFASEGYRNIFEIDPECIRANPSLNLEMIHPDDREIYARAKEEAAAERATDFYGEVRYILPDGKVKWIATTAQLNRESNGDVVVDGIDIDISDRVRKEEELRFQAQILDQIHDTVVATDLDGIITHWNPGATRIYGYRPEEAIGRSVSLLYFPEDLSWMEQEVIAPLKERGEHEIEVPNRHKDGRKLCIRLRLSLLRNSAGEIVGMIGCSNDITAYKQAELALRDSEEKFRQLAESIDQVFFIHDSATLDVLYVSPAFERIWGLSRDLIYEDPFAWAASLHPDDRERVLATGEPIQHGEEYAQRYRIIHADGGIRWIYSRTFPVVDESGNIYRIAGVAEDITERQRIEEALQQSEARYRQIVETAQEGIWLLNAENRTSFVNPSMARMLGYSQEEMIGRTLFDFMDGSGRAIAEYQIERRRQGITEQHDFRFQHREGHAVWVLISTNPILDEEGRYAGALGMITDITERKRNEEEIQRTTEELDRFFSVSLDLLCIANTDGYFLRLNPAWEKTLEYSLEELQSRKFLEFVHPDDLDRTLGALARLSAGGELIDFVNRYRHRDGSYRWIEWRAIPVGHTIYAAARDISDRVEMENALQESERRLAMALDGACAGIWSWDIATNRTYWSDGNYRLLGYEPGSIESSYDNWFKTVHPDDRGWVSDYVSGVVAAQRVLSLEYRVLLPDGGIRWLSDIGRLVYGQDGDLVGMTGIQIDITNRKLSELALQKAEERYSLATRAARVGVWEWNLKTNEFYLDPNVKALLGYTDAEIPNNDLPYWASFVHPDDREAVMAAAQAHLDGETPEYVFEHRMLHKNGSIVWILVRGQLLRDENGEPDRMVGTDTDITDRKQIEFALQKLNEELEARVQQRTQELARSEADMRTIFNNVYDAIYLHDLDGTILDFNDRALELHAATREQMLVATVPDLSAPDAPLDRLPEILRRAQSGENLQFEWRNRRFSDNSVFDVEVSLKQVSLGDRLVILIGVRDISDRKLAELERQKLAAIVENSTDLIGMSTLEGMSLYLNPAGQELMGLADPERLSAMPLGVFLSPEGAERFEREAIPTLMERGYWRGESIFRHLQTGEDIIAEQTLFFIRDPHTDVPLYIATISRDIRESKAIEARLLEQEQFLRSIYEGVDQPIFVADVLPDGSIRQVGWNPSAERFVGRTTAEVFGKRIEEIFPPREGAEILDRYRQCIAQRQSLTFEECFSDQEETHWMLSTYNPLIDDTGRVYRVVGKVYDITDRIRAEQALQANNEILRATIDNTPDVIFVKSRTGRILVANSSFANFFGQPAETLLGKADEELWPPDLVTHIQTIDNRIMDNGIPETFEESVPHSDGTLVYLTTKSPWYNSEGEVIGLIGLARDITDRKQAEEAIARSERDLRTIFDNVYDAVFIHDLDGTILDVNECALEQHRVSRKQVLAATIAEMSAADASLEELPGIFERVQAGETVRKSWKCRRLGDGERFIAEVTIKLVTLAARSVILVTSQDITARIALEQERERFVSLIENSNDFIGMADLEGRPFYLNQAGLRLVGLESLEALPFGYASDFIFSEDCERFEREAMPQQIETGLWRSEIRFQNFITGEPIAVDCYCFTLRDPNTGEVIARATVTRDIRERKQAERALQESEERFRTLFEATPNPIQGYDRDHRVIFWNRASEELYGYTQAEAIGKPVEELIVPPSLWSLIGPAVDDWITGRGGPIPDGELELMDKNGEIVTVFSSHIMLTNLSGDREMYCIDMDLRERKQAEAALQESRRFAQSIADKTPAALYIYDLVNYANIYSNRSIFELLGYTPEEIQAMGNNVMSILLHPDDIPLVATHQQNLLDAADGEDLELEYRMHHASGQWRWLYSRDGVFRRDEMGNVTQYIGSAQDITDRKNLEQELRRINTELEGRVAQRTAELQQAKEVAESANSAKSAFLANMSHELRTPLNGIMGYAQILQNSPRIPPEHNNDLQIIYQCGSHLLTLIEDILDFSKIEAGKMELYPAELSLPTFLLGVVEMCRIKAEQKGIAFTYQSAPDLPPVVLADEKRLRQVLLNLLGNAIKFTDQGEVTLAVTITGEKLTFVVEDTGIGIAQEHHRSIFEPFEQVGSPSRRNEGTGLGLPIAMRILQLMDSEFIVGSTLGEGSRFAFTVAFPIPDQLVSSPYLPPSRAIVGYHGPRQTILVVDDRADNREILIKLLEPLGFSLVEAVDGWDGLLQADRFHPDLAIVDLIMPNMNGLEMVRRLRRTEQGQHLPIIASSASVSHDDRHRGQEVGCDDFLPKPIQVEQLLAQLGQYLSIEWIYSTPPAEAETVLPPTPPAPEILAELQELARKGRIPALLQRVRHLEEVGAISPPFAQHLSQLVENFDLTRIRQFLDRYREN